MTMGSRGMWCGLKNLVLQECSLKSQISLSISRTVSAYMCVHCVCVVYLYLWKQLCWPICLGTLCMELGVGRCQGVVCSCIYQQAVTT
jgi:hypothetical protein